MSKRTGVTTPLESIMKGSSAEVTEVSALERRQFLAKGGAIAGALATLGIVDRSMAQSAASEASAGANLPPNVPQWSKELGSPTAVPYGKPSKFETEAIRHLYPGLVEAHVCLQRYTATRARWHYYS